MSNTKKVRDGLRLVPSTRVFSCDDCIAYSYDTEWGDGCCGIDPSNVELSHDLESESVKKWKADGHKFPLHCPLANVEE